MEHATVTDREAFAKIMANADKWATIDDIMGMCDKAGYWSETFLEESEVQSKKSHIRRLVRGLKDETNWPVWASVEKTDENGNKVRVYKQETLFDVDDYRQAVSYHSGVSNHHRAMASGYARRCRNRFNRQIPLNFG